jgi:hypothetical protein
VTVSSSMSMAVGGDGDHEGISGDLSCVGECSNSDEDQDSEEFHDCVEGHYADEDNLMRRVDAWRYDKNTDSHANDYIYYYRRSESRANDDGPPSDFRARDDGPPSDFRARNDVPPNNNCLNRESGNDRRTYIEILSPIPMSQYDNACACVAISHRPFAGHCFEAELNLGQNKSVLLDAMSQPKAHQEKGRGGPPAKGGGTPHQGGEMGHLAKTDEPIAQSKLESTSSVKVASGAVGLPVNIPKATTTIPESARPLAKSSNLSSPRDDVPGDEAIRAEEFPLPSSKKSSARRWATTTAIRAKIARASSPKSADLVGARPTDDPLNATTTTSTTLRPTSRPSTPSSSTSS